MRLSGPLFIKKMRGVAALEMVAMLIFVIFLAAMMMLVLKSLQRNHLVAEGEQIVSMLAYTQQEAVKSGHFIVLCPYVESKQNHCSSTENMAGWMVYTLGSSNNYLSKRILLRQPIQSQEENSIVASVGALPEQLSQTKIESSGLEMALSNSAGYSMVVFEPTGRPNRWGHFTVCDSKEEMAPVAIELTATGQIVLDGEALSCAAAR